MTIPYTHQIVPPKASDILQGMNEKMRNMDRDTLAFLVLWFKMMADVEMEEAMLRAAPLTADPMRAQPATNNMATIYHSVANLIRSAGEVTREDLDRIFYGVQP